jgi:hypothetical protein
LQSTETEVGLAVWDIDSGAAVCTVTLPVERKGAGKQLGLCVVDNVALVFRPATRMLHAVQLPPEVFA